MSVIFTKLDGIDLPIQFSYELPSPILRHTVVRTFNGVRMQSNATTIGADRIINWSVKAATIAEYAFFVTKFNANAEFVFTGYWGDAYKIRMVNFENGKVIARNVDFSGAFQVTEVTSEVVG